MFGSYFSSKESTGLDREVLEQIDEEARIILAHPDRYPHITVEMARRAQAMVARLRRSAPPEAELLSA